MDTLRFGVRLRRNWLTAIGILPASRVKNRLLSIPPGVSVSPTARIAPILLLNMRRMEIRPGASIAFGNVFRGLDFLRLAEGSSIGSWNWVTAAGAFAPYNSAIGEGALVLGDSTAITSRHYLDCTGGLTVGRMTTLAGERSTWLTHRINLSKSVQISAGTRVGDYCFIASGVQVAPGVTIADNSVVAMGSVVVKSLSQKGRLYGGVPARDLRAANNAAYTQRAVGRVDTRRL